MSSYGTLALINPTNAAFKFGFDRSNGGREWTIEAGGAEILPEEIAKFGAYLLAQREMRKEKGPRFVLSREKVEEFAKRYVKNTSEVIKTSETPVEAVEEVTPQVDEVEFEEVAELSEEDQELVKENNPTAFQAMELMKLTWKELAEKAQSLGKEVTEEMVKKQIVELIING